MSRSLGVAVLALCWSASLAAAERPRTLIIPQDNLQPGDIGPVGAVVPYKTVYINPCMPSGCVITPGTSNSINDRWGISAQRTLTQWPYGDASWQQVVSCVKDVFSPYVIDIVTTNPGSANHFEIMIAGRPTDLNTNWTGIGGIAPGGASCGSYLNNALVFAFAGVYGTGTTCDTACVNEVCATAAQEIGHAWSMDHVRIAADPMTYFGYSGRRYFQNMAAQCGSDCVNGQSPNGQTCTGLNEQSHSCIPCSSSQTQNSYERIKGLFGVGPGTPPTVKISGPKTGDSVQPGFSVYVEATDDSGAISKVELKVDGVMVGMLDKGPFVFNAPATLANGTHRVVATAYDPHQTPGTSQVDVIIGEPCGRPSDCPLDTDTCVGGRCVPGAGVPGGLGSDCTNGTECASGQCASDGTSMYCVEQCMVGQCPSDFGCLEETPGVGGVCWPGFDDGSGGCGCQSNRPGGPLSLGLLFAVVLFTWRRRR